MAPSYVKQRAAISPGWSALSLAIRSSCKKWRSMFRTPAPTRRLQSWWMNARMACICHMTGWPVFWLRTKTVMRSGVRKIWTTKSKRCCAKGQPKCPLEVPLEKEAGATQEDLMNADVLTTRVADRIAVITLGSAKRIYFDAEMGDALTAALDGFAGDANVRVVVVTGGAPGYFIRHFPSLRSSASQSPCAPPVANGPRTRPTIR